jgi:hypothetical protein
VPEIRKRSHHQIPLVDSLAVIVGYGMAAELFRACWPSSPPAPVLRLPIATLYIWIGMAMSGPPLLLWRGFARPAVATQGTQSPQATRATWAETAWLLIGIYWIVIGLFLIPARLRGFQLTDTVLFGIIPFAVSLGFWLCRPRKANESVPSHPWTHTTAVVLLAMWPVAWFCLIVLGKSMG